MLALGGERDADRLCDYALASSAKRMGPPPTPLPLCGASKKSDFFCPPPPNGTRIAIKRLFEFLNLINRG
jgi:hypothetical protein